MKDFYLRLISGTTIMLEEAEKSQLQGDTPRCEFFLNDIVKFLTNGLKSKKASKCESDKPPKE